MINRRKFDSHIKSLVHFDYPYFNEPDDGCRDEISGNIFIRHGNVKFAESEKPCDEIISGTPKFGYRCLHTQSANDYIYALNNGNFDIASKGTYEFEFWIKPASSSTGNIVSIFKGNTAVLSIGINSANKITFTNSDTGMNLTSGSALSINTWHHVKARMHSKTGEILIDGSVKASGEYEDEKISVSETVNEIRLGGFSGYLDEFIMRDSLSPDNLNSEPYQGRLDLNSLGGFGNSRAGIGIRSTDTCLNSYGHVKSVSGRKITLEDVSESSFSGFTSGTEIMLHVSTKSSSDESELGSYAFRKIESANGKILTLDKAVTEEFNLASCCEKYHVQAISVPNYSSVEVAAEGEIVPLKYAKNRGGIIAFRSAGDVTVNGKILSIKENGSDVIAYGPDRDDNIQMTHSDLVNRFLINRGGGIFIACGGTFKSDINARIGAFWLGVQIPAGKPNSTGVMSRSAGGGAGYGGAGGSDCDNGGIGGSGGVGGGGGGGDGIYGGDAGERGRKMNSGIITGNAGTGGAGSEWGTRACTDGGTAGIMLNSKNAPGSSGGGGAGGNSGSSGTTPGSTSGACVILIAKRLSADAASISTGGAGGYGEANCGGGGGTGFAYIACEEMI